MVPRQCRMVCYLYLLYHYMRPKGPLYQPAVALADSSGFFLTPLHKTKSRPQHCGPYWDNPFSYYPEPPYQGKIKTTKEKNKGKKQRNSSLGWARPGLLLLTPDPLLVPVAAYPSPPGRHPAFHSRAPQQLYNSLGISLLLSPPNRRRLQMFPQTILANPPPQPSDLRGSRYTLHTP